MLTSETQREEAVRRAREEDQAHPVRLEEGEKCYRSGCQSDPTHGSLADRGRSRVRVCGEHTDGPGFWGVWPLNLADDGEAGTER